MAYFISFSGKPKSPVREPHVRCLLCCTCHLRGSLYPCSCLACFSPRVLHLKDASRERSVPEHLWCWDERSKAVPRHLISPLAERGIALDRWQEKALATGTTLLLHPVGSWSASGDVPVNGALHSVCTAHD